MLSFFIRANFPSKWWLQSTKTFITSAQTIKVGTEKEKQESWIHSIGGSETLLKVKGRKVLGERLMHRFGDFPHFWITFFSMNVNSPVYREEMAHKTQEINKTYKAQKAHESVQTLKPPHTMEPHQATQGARGHSFKWCSGGISSDRVVYFCKQWHWFIKLDLNTVISWACHGYRYLGQINTGVRLLRKNQTTLRRGWHLSPIR